MYNLGKWGIKKNMPRRCEVQDKKFYIWPYLYNENFCLASQIILCICTWCINQHFLISRRRVLPSQFAIPNLTYLNICYTAIPKELAFLASNYCPMLMFNPTLPTYTYVYIMNTNIYFNEYAKQFHMPSQSCVSYGLYFILILNT